MRQLLRVRTAVIVYTCMLCATAAWATPPAVATFGTSWDGPGTSLQTIIDNYLASSGAPAGSVNAYTDYMGAHDLDIDPWFWVGHDVNAFLVTEIAGNKDINSVGWYVENGGVPVLSGNGSTDGVVFPGPRGAGTNAVFTLPADRTKFGFYLDTHRMVTGPNGSFPEIFYTNRKFNDAGRYGFGATRAPWDGDIQALVFDVSRWKGPNTFLVCFEDLDAGDTVSPISGIGTDSDYNDFVFQVTALGATPTKSLTFGALKALYR